jgi:major membrane immunogen (membrane-anchored lipoprotein)
MKNLLYLIIASIFLLTCQSSEDSLDAIKKFRPDDKYFKAGLVGLHFKIETSPIPEVDSLFNKLINHFNLPIKAEGCNDGVFIGESPYDAYDYKHVVKLEIKDEKIVKVDYNETHKNGKGKQEDEEYCKEMGVSGMSPDIAYPKMEKQLLETQDIMYIDAVTGASYSLYRFRYAVIVALMKAKMPSN